MSAPPPTVPCPTCGKAVPWKTASRYRPFCSRRCRLIDLGDWLAEEHRIAGEPAPDADTPARRNGEDDDSYAGGR